MSLASGLAIFGISVALALYSAHTLARRFANDAAEIFWLTFAGVASQLGSISLLLSLFQALTPGAFLALQVLLAAAVFRFRPRAPGAPASPAAFSRLEAVLLCALLGVLALSLLQQILVSRIDGDARMYHASRTIYWLQHQSLLPWITHNDRQVMFGFGAELFFFWPVLFTRADLTGFVMSWISLPLASAGVYFVTREFRLSRTVALAAALFFTCTPRVIEQAHNMKPEPWVVACSLGCLFWLLRACASDNSAPRSYFLAAFFAILAMNAKFYAAPALVLTLLLACVPLGWRRPRAALAGAALAFFLSGLVVPVFYNLGHFRHPFGSSTFRARHSADLSLNQSRVHLIRLSLLLFDLPWNPSPALRETLRQHGEQLLDSAGAAVLPGEDSAPDKRVFRFQTFIYGVGYSLGGLLLLPLLVVSLVYAARRRDRGVLTAALFVSGSLFSVVLLIRWTSFFDAPSRFILPAYALSIPLGACLIARLRSPRVRTLIAALLLAAVAIVPAGGLALRVLHSFHDKSDPEVVSNRAEWSNAIPHLPPGSRILVFARANAADYDLFLPKLGYPNYVVSWGKEDFNSDRLQRLVRDHRISHVLIQNERSLSSSWDPPISTLELVRWLSSRPDFIQVPGIQPPVRLFTIAPKLSTAVPNPTTFRPSLKPCSKGLKFLRASRLES
jgi:hypothetical protein